MRLSAAFDWFKTAANTNDVNGVFDPYKILGISRRASNEELKRCYRQLAMTYHPDIGGDAIRITQINVAYNMIRKKRGI